MIAISVEIAGAQELLRGFAGIEKFFDNMEPILEPVGVEALSDIQHGFDVGGPGWAEHATSTRKRKVGPSRILWNTGALRDSFEKNAAGNIFRLSVREMEVGSNIFYGIYHQEGRGHNPVRLIINVNPEQEKKYAEVSLDKIADAVRALGFEVS